MTLKEYLKVRNYSNSKNTSVAECKALGIEYGHTRGWLEKHLGMEIPLLVVQGLAAFVILSPWSKQRIKRNLAKMLVGPPEPFNKTRWNRVRTEFLATCDNKECALCQSRESLEVDHILPKSIFHDLAYSKKNLQILCATCNRNKSNFVDIALLPDYLAGKFSE